MMNKYIIIILAGLALLGFTNKADRELNGNKVDTFTYLEDGEVREFYSVSDTEGVPLFYYREVRQYPCKSEKVCRMMNLTMYFDVYGNFIRFELEKNDPLTKLNHKYFNDKDYKKLHKILNNSNSELQYCKYDKLTSEECENQYHVDAISGATMADIEFEYINGAIKTTYALWKIANGNLSDSIKNTTCKKMLRLSKTAKQEENTPTEIWTTYNAADRYQKVLLLSEFQTKQTTFDSTGEVYKAIETNDVLIALGWMKVLSQQKTNTKAIKMHLIPVLENPEDTRYMAAYNTIQCLGQNRLLKNYELNIWVK